MMAIRFGFLVLILPWLVYAVVLIMGPVVHHAVHPTVLITFAGFIAISALFLVIGSSTARSGSGRKVRAAQRATERRFVRWLALLAGAYVVVSVYDTFVVRGVNITQLTDARYAAATMGPRGSILGALRFLLAGAPPLLISAILTGRDLELPASRTIGAMLLGIAGMLTTFLGGGRNGFLIGTAVVLVAVALDRQIRDVGEARFGNGFRRLAAKIRQRRRHLAAVVVVFAGGISYSFYLFAERAWQRSGSLAARMLDLEATYGLALRNGGLEDGLLAIVRMIGAYSAYYVTISSQMFSEYFFAGYSPRLLGAHTLWFPARIVDAVFGTTYFGRASEAVLTYGTYLSMPGDLYVELGFAGVALGAAGLGFLLGYDLRRAQLTKRRVNILRSAIWSAVGLFAPVYALWGAGNGLSLIVLAVAVSGLSRVAVRPMWVNSVRGVPTG